MEETKFIETLQNMASLIAATEAAKTAKGSSTTIKTYTRHIDGIKFPSEFQINAAPGNYNAVKSGMRHCFWFWLSKPDLMSPMRDPIIYKGAVYMGGGEAYVCPKTDLMAAAYLVEADKLFQHFAESYFLYTLGGDKRFEEHQYPETEDLLQGFFVKRKRSFGGAR